MIVTMAHPVRSMSTTKTLTGPHANTDSDGLQHCTVGISVGKMNAETPKRTHESWRQVCIWVIWRMVHRSQEGTCGASMSGAEGAGGLHMARACRMDFCVARWHNLVGK